MWQYGKLPKGWSIEKIGEYASVITDYVANGSFAALAENVNYKSEPDYAVLIRLTDYNNNFNSDFVYIDEHAYEFLSKSKLYGNEIIISNVGANVGTVFKCPKLQKKMSLAPNAIMLKTKGNDDFYYYWFTSRNGQHSLQSIVTGSAQPKFNKTNFKELLVPVPPLDVQEKIAEYLCDIDKKIELNKNINENLETQAQAIFTNMFAKNNSVISATIADIALNITDGVHNTVHDDPQGNYFLLSCKNIKGSALNIANSDRRISLETFEKLRRRTKLSKGDVLISSVGTVGELLLLNEEPHNYEFQRSVAMIKPNLNIVSPAYLYESLLNKKTELINAAHGAVQQCLFISDISNFPIGIPQSDDLRKFDAIVTPIFDIITANETENRRLSDIRDTLLPKFMSGEIDVSTFDL